MVALPFAMVSTVAAAGYRIVERHFAGPVRAAVNALLLRAADVRAPVDSVVALLLGPVADPLELVLGFLSGQLHPFTPSA